MTTILNFDGDIFPAIKRGASWRQELEWRDSSGNLIDLSYYTGIIQVRKNYSQELIIELSTQNGRITFPSLGKIVLSITSAESALLTPGKYIYDFFLSDISSGDSNGDQGTIPFLEGSIVVKSSTIEG